jgi:pimeloyl-ACP methyl ester carboxylesterase
MSVQHVCLQTADGVDLRGVHLPGPVGGPVFVIGHGFTNSIAKVSTRAVIDGFARFGAVIALDFRGHGRSDGFGSVGRDEVLDLDAAVGFAGQQGYGRVHSVGFSMGASIALRHAALGARSVDTVIAVSSPSRWYIRETAPMRRVHWLLENPLGPVVGRLLGVRLGAPWPVIPQTPLEVIERIAPTPLLLVHGTADHYFSPEHAVALHGASAQHAELWIEPGMGHAESATTPGLIDRMAGWTQALGTTSGHD